MSKVGVGRVGTWSLFSIIMAKTFFILLASLIIVSSAYAQNFTFNGVCYHLIDDNGEKAKRYEEESARFREKWKQDLEAGDPYYNVNFSLDRSDYSLRV